MAERRTEAGIIYSLLFVDLEAYQVGQWVLIVVVIEIKSLQSS